MHDWMNVKWKWMWTTAWPGQRGSKIKGSKQNLTFKPAPVATISLYYNCPFYHLKCSTSTTGSDYGKKYQTHKGKVLTTAGVSVSVGMFSSVMLLVSENQWSRQSLPVISIGLLEQQDFWGTDGSLATQWTLQLLVHGYWHPICFKFLPIQLHCWSVGTSTLFSTGPGQSTRRTASTADKLPNLC